MLVLAIDSSATASVALARLHETGYDLLAVRETDDTRSHAEVMAPFVREVLDDAGVASSDLDALVTGTGPGPFTGLRAGIVTARTLGFAWNLPVYGLMSLTALAEEVFDSALAAGHTEILVATDARRREVYSARYALSVGGYELLEGPTVGKAEELADLPAYGRGAGLYPDALQAVEGFSNLQPRARFLLAAAARAGIENLSTDTAALYLRESDAKVPAARKKASA